MADLVLGLKLSLPWRQVDSGGISAGVQCGPAPAAHCGPRRRKPRYLVSGARLPLRDHRLLETRRAGWGVAPHEHRDSDRTKAQAKIARLRLERRIWAVATESAAIALLLYVHEERFGGQPSVRHSYVPRLRGHLPGIFTNRPPQRTRVKKPITNLRVGRRRGARCMQKNFCAGFGLARVAGSAPRGGVVGSFPILHRVREESAL